MRETRATYGKVYCLVLLLALLLGACTADDSDSTKGEGRQLKVSLAANAYQDGGMTRGLPAGYSVLDVATAFPKGKDLLAFIAHSTNASEVLSRRLEYAKDEQTNVFDWQQNITITDYSKPYCIYGFVPISDDTSDNASASLLDGRTSYDDGMKITVRNLKPLTASDPCVIVGIKDWGTATSIADVDIRQGAFSYSFSSEKMHDKICMLLDHIYAKFHFQIKVSAAYDALRTVKVKKMQLEVLDNNSDQVVNAVTATVDIFANNKGTNPISSITYRRSAGSVTPYTLFDCEADPDNPTEPLLLTTSAQSIGTCQAPYDQQRFRLTTEYEVYDKPTDASVMPQLLKSHTTPNKFTAVIGGDKKKWGYEHTVTITVNPTYLQVLSDYDLDNPTFTIN